MDSIEKILENGEIFSAIINNAFDAIIIYKPIRNNLGEIIDFEFLYLNETAVKVLHGAKEKYIGHTFLSFFPYASQDGMFAMFRNVVDTGEAMEGTFYYEHGEYKGWYRDSALKYKDGLIVYFREVTFQKQTELELKKTLVEKDILLRETHHRVKNNLQIISSLLNLQSNNYVTPEFKGTCQSCINRIRTISDIHQQLYAEDDFQSVNIKNFIEEVIAAARSDNKIIMKYDVDEVKINLTSAIGIGLIIYELLTNSIIHGLKNKDEGIIEIAIKDSFPNLLISFSDNGNGLPKGFNINEIESLGLILVQTVVAQLEGKLEIFDIEGTQFVLTLPNAVYQR